LAFYIHIYRLMIYMAQSPCSFLPLADSPCSLFYSPLLTWKSSLLWQDPSTLVPVADNWSSHFPPLAYIPLIPGEWCSRWAPQVKGPNPCSSGYISTTHQSFLCCTLSPAIHFNGSNGTAYTRPSKVQHPAQEVPIVFIFSSATPQRTAYREVSSQMAAHLRTGSLLYAGEIAGFEPRTAVSQSGVANNEPPLL
jgi:hypothetical protein